LNAYAVARIDDETEPVKTVSLWDSNWRRRWFSVTPGVHVTLDDAVANCPDAVHVTVEVGRLRWAGRILRNGSSVVRQIDGVELREPVTVIEGPVFTATIGGHGVVDVLGARGVTWDRLRRTVTVDLQSVYTAAIDDYFAGAWPGTTGLIR
jgi:hypothetical protein